MAVSAPSVAVAMPHATVAVAVAAERVVEGAQHAAVEESIINILDTCNLFTERYLFTYNRLTPIPIALVMSMIWASTSKSIVRRRWMASKQRMAVRNQII